MNTKRQLSPQIRSTTQAPKIANASAPLISAQSHGVPGIARCACGGGCPQCQMKSGGAVSVSQPGDPFEREADHVADQVMRMAEPAPVDAAPVAIQRKCSACEDEEKKMIQTRREPSV